MVGWLRKGKTYRAPCRWYPDGPVGTIEYYVAAPGAKYYEGEHIFFPLGFWAKDGIGGDVGELTNGEDYKREIDAKIAPATEPGIAYSGSVADFRGETPYPGPFEGEIECIPAIIEQSYEGFETDTTGISFEAPVVLTYDCIFFPGGVRDSWEVTFSGLVDGPLFNASVFNGTHTLPYDTGCVWRKTVATGRTIHLGRNLGFWNLAILNSSTVVAQWRTTTSLDASSPKTLTLESVPAWDGDNFGSPPITTIIIS